MPNTLQAALLFLIDTLFTLYLYILIVRFILVWVGANYFNPLTQFIVRCTDFIIKPLRRLIPNYKKIEISTLVLIIILEMFKYVLLSSLNFQFPNLFGVLVMATGDMLKLIIQTFFYAIVLQAIISWVQPHSPVSFTLYQLTSPIMRPIQRLVPPIGGFDISPIPAIILLQLLLIILIQPIMRYGIGVAFG